VTSPAHPHDPTLDVIAEFTEVFAFIRSRWTDYSVQIHPELSGGSIFVLQTIVRKGPITATEIAHRLLMDKGMISRQVTLLKRLELIEARPAASDRRVTLLTGTALAQTRLGDVRGQMAEEYRRRFAGWDDAELGQLRDMLRRFNGSAEAFDLPDSPAARCTSERHSG
jgi:DNA-binding MarR family transcriptional regulator